MLPKFNLLQAHSIKEASDYARLNGEQARFYAGGTDLFVVMHEGNAAIPNLISLQGIPRLLGIDVLADGWVSIGALATFNEIVSHPYIAEKYPHFVQAMSHIGSYQVRNLATIGGNICSAVPSADSAPVLLVSQARVLISNGDSEREVPIDAFFVSPRKTVLQPGEIVTRIIVPPASATDLTCFIKRGTRKSMTISLVSVAGRLRLANGRVEDCALALGSVAPTPIRARAAEQALLGQVLTRETIDQAAAVAAAEDCRPIDDVRASAEYRRSMVQALMRRALTPAADIR